MISTDPFVWISAFFTICSFTLLYGDNVLFRIGEYTFAGTVVAHGVITGITTMQSSWYPFFAGQNPLGIISIILAFMSLAVVVRKYAWIASFPIAVMIGVGTGVSVRALVQTDILGNIHATITEAGLIFVGNPADGFGYFVRVIFTIVCTAYLLFTVFLRGPVSKPLSYIRTLGKYFFLIYFGLSVGNGVMQLSGLATSAINRLLVQWLGL
jgi:hypothetical protein